jgi:AAA domain/Bifunctional DNA primase/polymerase, N-terminal
MPAPEQAQQSGPTSRLEIALAYIKRGWALVPIPFREKAPRIRGWTKLRITEAPSYFDGPGNIGVILGEASGGLVDIDLDCSEAVELARVHLPATEAIFGRQGKPRSHWLYRVKGNAPTIQIKDPLTKEMLLELRGDGGFQTVFPGSVHESDEPIEWVIQGEPLRIEYTVLCKAVRHLAARCLIKRYCSEAIDRTGLQTALGRIDIRVANMLRELCDLAVASMPSTNERLPVSQVWPWANALPDYLKDLPNRNLARIALLSLARGDLKDCVAELKKQEEPGRANLLFKKSIRMGVLIAQGQIEKNEVFNAFIGASIDNGLVDKNGAREVRRQIEKGFQIGAEKAANDNISQGTPRSSARQAPISATAFEAIDPPAIPRREWLYGGHYIRKFITATIAAGGVGKSALKLTEAISMSIGRDLLDGNKTITRLRVWYWNGEDPKDEIVRRVVAICMHYKIDQKELEGSLFVDSGHEMPIRLAIEDHGRVVIDDQVVRAISDSIEKNKIDAMIVDPFIAIHKVSENNNPSIDQVVKQLGWIANLQNCAIEIVHHVRKPSAGQHDVTADDSRGGGAIVNAVRSCRVLNRMSNDEAERARVEPDDRYRYIRVDSGKQNLAPPEKAKWRYLASICLPNGDSVQVVECWQFPEAVQRGTAEDMEFIRLAVRDTAYRWDTRAKDWIGKVVADRLGLDPESKADKEDIKAFLSVCRKQGLIAVEERPDDKRRRREFVVSGPGKWASGSRMGTEGANGDE